MNRIDFMRRLELLLSDLPENERREAVQYYNDYFNDAGVQNEEEVLESLGTPEEVAGSIREGLREEAREKGEFSEKGFKQEPDKKENEVLSRKQDGQKQEKKDAGDRYRTEGRKKGMSASAVALIVICCLVASPVLIPLAITLIVVLAVLGAVFISLVLVFLLVGVVCIVSGVIAFFGSLTELFLAPASAVMGIGMSLIAVGAGILLTMLLVFVISKIFPAAFCKTADWVSSLFHKKGGKKG